MRKGTLLWGLAAGVLALPLVLKGAAVAAPGDGLRNSVHDFTDSQNTAAFVDDSGATGKTSLCVFCHIPHRFRGDNAPGTRLLWNHQASGNTYGWSDVTKTHAGTDLPTNIDTWAGTTKLCLSCHDGTISIGALYRGGGTWTYTGTKIDNTGVISGTGHFFPNGDLKGNHPVSIPYPYGGAVSTYNGITSQADIADFITSPVNVKLYTDIGGEAIEGATVGSSGMECASCHDPHNKDTVEDHLLRDTYQDAPKGQLCLDCHDK